MPTASVNGVAIEYEEAGSRDAPALLLIMGLGWQLIHWPDVMVEALARAGFRVIRFDNRDCGRSETLDRLGVPDLAKALAQSPSAADFRPPYLLADMAADAAALLERLDGNAAHIVGLSMGGAIAQILAATHPAHARLTCIMATSGNPALPGATEAAREMLTARPRAWEREAIADLAAAVARVFAGARYPADEEYVRSVTRRAFDRGLSPAGYARQLAAIAGSGSRVELLPTIKAPTLVIHGSDDPLLPPDCGRDIAESIPGARLEIVEGLGHQLPPAAARDLAPLIVDHCRGAR